MHARLNTGGIYRLLPVHASVVEVHGEVVVLEVIEHYEIVSAAANHDSCHAVLKQIVGDDRPAQLVVQVHSLHGWPPERPSLRVADVPETASARVRPSKSRMQNPISAVHVAHDDVASLNPRASCVPATTFTHVGCEFGRRIPGAAV
jgi:hypothetical protein